MSEPYDPFEDDGTGYIDSRPGITPGSAGSIQLYDLTDDEIADYLDCQEARKRVPIGFQLPANEGARQRGKTRSHRRRGKRRSH